VTGPSGNNADAPAIERIVFFSDAVIAIAITLLALGLHVPNLAGATDASFLDALGAQLPNFTAFCLSFVVIGIYWMSHNRAFRFIVRWDYGLLAVNLLFLFFVVLLPFLTTILGGYGNLPSAASVYALGLAAMGFASCGLWAYAVRRRLVSEAVTPVLARHLLLRWFVVPVVFLASVPLAFVAPVLAQATWLLVLLAQAPLARYLPGPPVSRV
jgi:uncharacterized membrane protein